MKNVAVVAIGGIVGSLARWFISLTFVETGFPWGTLLVNYVGSVLLIILLLYVKDYKSEKWWWRPALGSGFCGGFTTYSALALKVEQDFQNGNYGSAIIYSFASILGTYILVFMTHELLKNRWVR